MATSKPNILLLFADQQRADALGCADPISGQGRSVVRTPNLDRLASEGARFTHAVTPQPICIAARYSLITGLRPRHHCWTSNGRLPQPTPELPTIMTVLGTAG